MSAAAQAGVSNAAVRMDLSSMARRLIDGEPAQDGAASVRMLLQHGLNDDGLSLALHLLPRPYAIAWACGCVREHSPWFQGERGFVLVQAWVQDPSERNRSEVLRFLEDGPKEDVSASLGLAVVFVGPNGSGGDDAIVIAEEATALWANAALQSLAARDPENYQQHVGKWAGSSADLLARLKL